MYGLTSTLSTASQALNADSGAIAITNNNIANVSTPGYSRQIVNLSADAIGSAGATQDNGVSFGGYSSVRDQVLQLTISGKTSDLGSAQAQSAAWATIEPSFSGTTTGVGAALSNFFSNVSGLSTSPDDAGTRESAYTSAQQLVDAFHQAASSLSQAQASANQTAAGTVLQVNQLTAQIAQLNAQLAQLSPGQDGGSLQDNRDQLTNQLASLVGLTTISTGGAPTLTLSNGTPLVVGSTSYALQTAGDPTGNVHVLDSNGEDITSSISSGSLGGTLQLRDGSLAAATTTLNQFASGFATAVNAAQANGYDPSGGPGQPMFAYGGDGTATAGNLTLALNSSAGLATSSDGSPGSSGNVAALAAVQTQTLQNGQAPGDTYASLVQQIGNASASATASQTATQTVLSQLQSQQSATSGVSVDEETTNLLKYQQAYSAAAQVISTVNNLFSILLNMSTVTS